MKSLSIQALMGWLLLWLCFPAYGQSVCSTTAAGNWATNTLWSCGSAPSGAYSGTIIVQHNLTINSPITISGKVVIYLKNNATIDVRGSNSLSLLNNDSVIDVGSGSSVGGQSNNSTVIIGTGASSYTYKLNGQAVFKGPDLMTSRGLGSLPVELAHFTVVAEGQQVVVNWATATEHNTDRFVVERSHDLRDFEPIGSLPAAGTTQVRQTYALIDPQPLPELSYYRLRQVDRDGQYTLSRPVSVRIADIEPDVLLLGNPVQTGVIRLIAKQMQNLNYQLTDVQGRTVPLEAQLQPDNVVHLVLPSSTNRGIYVLTVHHATGQLTRRIRID